jgi:hypothetical protein
LARQTTEPFAPKATSREDGSVTTDLTGDFGLGEEEFDWDVFVPDPDDAEIAAEAAALEDEDELDLDDSEFDWDAALREDPEPEAGADGGARAGAAYDRIVDTVRRSFEDPEPLADFEPEPVAVHATETPTPSESRPEVENLAFAPEPEAERRQGVWLPETELGAEAELEEASEWGPEPDTARAPGAISEWRPEAFPQTEDNLEPEAAVEPEADLEPEATLELEAEPEWEPELEPAEARIAEMAAAVASVGPAESFPVPPSEARAAVSEEDGLRQDIGEAAPAESPVSLPTRTSRTHKKHEQNRISRVFTATVVLACLALVLVVAAAVVHSRHHPPTGGAPTHAAPPTSSSSETARIQTATDALDSATTSATVGLSSLPTFPTPSNVEKVINPYMSSLQLFGTLLSGSTVPSRARSAASNAEAQVRQDLQFLDTIDALPPLQLGAFLKQFDADAAQLQTTLSALEQNLRSASS